MQNPFLLVFGRSPLESVSRLVQTNEIIEMFSADLYDYRGTRQWKESYADGYYKAFPKRKRMDRY